MMEVLGALQIGGAEPGGEVAELVSNADAAAR